MNNNQQEFIKKILAILAVIILAVLVGHIITNVSFNQKLHKVKGADSSAASYMDFASREDSTSTWVKRDFDLYGKTVDLNADTIDGTLYNKSANEISDWSMTLHIKDDCLINNAWCGTVEIHQFTGTDKEAVQTLDLRNYKIEEVKLEYLYDGDLLIPLNKGDYIVYYPSEKDDEIPIAPQSELTIGTIFYYVDSIDLSDYEISYNYHRKMTEGIGFYAIIILAILWLGLLVMMLVARASYRRAVNEMEIRMSGLSYMSEIYSIIYIIDLEEDRLTPIAADEESEKLRPKNIGARDQLLNLFAADAEMHYVELMQEFADLLTLPDRLKGDSIALDYLSKSHGWNQIRFIAMDRENDQPLKRVLFTIQDINSEKQTSEKHETRLAQMEAEQKAKVLFFDILSERVIDSLGEIRDYAGRIKAESSDEQIRGYADVIEMEGQKLLYRADRMTDASDIYAGKIQPRMEEYSLSEMLEDVCAEVRQAADDKGIGFHLDRGPGIPDRLRGDSPRIRQTLLYLLIKGIHHTEQGEVRLSVFGKQTDHQVHLLFSIKDNGDGIRHKDLKRLSEEWSRKDHTWKFTREEPGLGLTLYHELLVLMGSQLHVNSEYGHGCEFYFEIDQEVVEE